MVSLDALEWEEMWAPYDEDTYRRALDFVPRGSVVLDIGAGDLRFARRVAGQARKVYAVEQRPELISEMRLPSNVIAICGDARTLAFPPDIDTAVLLMRHCRHFSLYLDKLEATGCERLVTNARWGMDVECIDLTTPPIPYNNLEIGWYACRCGATGFRPGPPELLTQQLAESINEVDQCPECVHYGRISHRIT